MYKAYKRSKDQSFAKKFKSFKQAIQKQTRRAYWIYVEELFTPSEDDNEYSATKRFWSYIKHRKTENNRIASLKVDGKLVSHAKDKAYILNNQF